MEPIKLTQISDPKNLKDTVNQLIGEVTALQNDKVKLQSKTVTPTKDIQLVEPDEAYAGLSVVAVYPIPDEYVTPSGSLTITENNKYNVTSYAEVDVAVPVTGETVALQQKTVTPTKAAQRVVADAGYTGLSEVEVTPIPDEYIIPSGTERVTANGIYDIKDKENVEVAVPSEEPNLITKEITENGTYNASDDGADGYSSVSVNVEGSECVNGFQWKIDNMNNLYREFAECQLENVDGALVGLDTTNLKSTKSMLQNCPNLISAPMFDMSHVEDTTTMFANSPKLVSVPEYDLSSCTNATSMFSSCSSLASVSLKNTGNIANMYAMFNMCKQMTSAPELDTSGATDMRQMFYGCSAMVDAPEYDMSSCTKAKDMFYGCSNLTDIKLNLPKVTDVSQMFYGCSKLENADLSLPTDLGVSYLANYMLRNCSRLTNINLNFSRASNLQYCFQYCSRLEEAHLTSTSNATNVNSMFQDCTNLTTVTGLDVINVTTGSITPFGGCENLTNLTIKNIKKPLYIGASDIYGHLLTVDSLINTIKELWDRSSETSTYQLAIGTENLPKLDGVYVKLIAVTDEMIANDPYASNKKPCVVCESTDEGAMAITEYATSKNWSLV